MRWVSAGKWPIIRDITAVDPRSGDLESATVSASIEAAESSGRRSSAPNWRRGDSPVGADDGLSGFGRGLAYRLARAGVLVAITVGVILSSFQVYLDYGSQRAALDRQIEELLGVASKPAARAVFTIDYALADQVAQSLLIYEFVIEAKIIGDHGELLGAAEKSMEGRPEHALKGLIDEQVELRRSLAPPIAQSQAVGQGEMIVKISRGEALSGFMDRAIVVFLVGMARNVFLILVLLFVFHYIAAKPLRELVESFRAIDSSDPGSSRIHSPNGHEDDELGALARAGDRFVIEVSEQIAIRRATERQLEEQIAETQSALNASNVASEAKSTFLAHMSHELRTPLNAILGYSELITDKDNTFSAEKNVEFVAQIHRAGKILHAHIDDILTFSELDRGGRPLDLKPESLRGTVVDAMGLLRLTMRSRQITAHLHDTARDTMVLSDRRALHQVLVNVLANAVKFSPEKSQIVIELAENQDFGVVTIRDEGPGIAPEEMERVLEPFTRSNNPLVASQPGTGLGLPISLRLVEKMGGVLLLSPREPKGLDVTIRIPLAAA
jgi:signal transduction histidine kinase